MPHITEQNPPCSVCKRFNINTISTPHLDGSKTYYSGAYEPTTSRLHVCLFLTRIAERVSHKLIERSNALVLSCECRMPGNYCSHMHVHTAPPSMDDHSVEQKKRLYAQKTSVNQ